MTNEEIKKTNGAMIAIKPESSREYHPTASQSLLIQSCLNKDESPEDVLEKALENYIKDEKTGHKRFLEDSDD